MGDEKEFAKLIEEVNEYIHMVRENCESENRLVMNSHQLMSDRQQLRSDDEEKEEKQTRKKSRQPARPHDRNPFVLVLVDGDSYIVSFSSFSFFFFFQRESGRKLTSSSSTTNISKPAPMVAYALPRP